MKVFTIRWAWLPWILTSIILVSAQGAIQDAARKNAILLAEVKLEAAARLSTISTSIVIATPTTPALAPASKDMATAEDIPEYWDESVWQAEYFLLLHSLRHDQTRSSSSNYSSGCSDFGGTTRASAPSPSLNFLLARINLLEAACFSGKLKKCRLSKNWRAEEALSTPSSYDATKEFYRNLWCESEKDRFVKTYRSAMEDKEGTDMEKDRVEGKDKAGKEAQLEEGGLKASLEAERVLVELGCAISRRTSRKEWRRWDLVRSNLNPADYETKFPGWAGLLVGFVGGLLMTAMAVWVVWRWYALEVWKVVFARATAGPAREVGGGGGRRVLDGGRGRRDAGVVDRPPPYAALERPPPAYVEMVRLGDERM